MEKPFFFGVATSGDNFTDREKETQRLLLNFAHGVNTVLISPRRSVSYTHLAEHNFFCSYSYILKDICWYQMVQTNMITMIMCIEYGISISYD